ncbi:MAG TPA: bifunctional phosphoribosyl-AMP cyclohydrolase/phosphoribosyl-ATP diphosphatase HisIE [Longimicrobiaceae bacterium]|nr:bifunctional phosphoribosyl-AMP cyclohydrolase/phosphoribosyl-ATP diphosphatase HisIE [Longimicrobiaceae bacterium]
MQGNTRIDRIEQLDALDFAQGDGLLPLVAQHARTGEVLMLGYADREALGRTLQSGTLWFWSRSRERLWQKGETSGNVLRLVALHADCDADALVALVEPAGPTCHTGRWSCFEAPPTLAALDRTLATRAAAPTEDSYTARLLGDRNLRLKKIGEEAAELAVACADQDTERAAEEAADLIYHALVACRALGVSADQVLERLATRMHRPAA